MRLINREDLRSYAIDPGNKTHLPKLISDLVQSSVQFEKCYFPSREGVQLPGYDGEVVALESYLHFVPEGKSVWEIGTDKRTKTKIKTDFEKRVKKTKLDNPSDYSFVLVTPLRASKEQELIDDLNAISNGVFKEVRVLFAEDLLQWLEHRINVQVSFAKYLNKVPQVGWEILSNWQQGWMSNTEITLSNQLVIGGRYDHLNHLKKWYEKGEGLIFVADETRELSVGFVSSALKSIQHQLKINILNRCIFVAEEQALKDFPRAAFKGIIVTTNLNSSIHKAQLEKGYRVIVCTDKKNTKREASTIILPQLNRNKSRQALLGLGINDAAVTKIVKDADCRLNLIREALGFEVSKPSWVKPENRDALIPALLSGKWNKRYIGDQLFVEDLSGKTIEALVDSIQLIQSDSEVKFLKPKPKTEKVFSDQEKSLSTRINWGYLNSFITKSWLEKFGQLAPVIFADENPDIRKSLEGLNFKIYQQEEPGFSSSLKEGVLESLFYISQISDCPVNEQMNVKGFVDQVIAEILNTKSLDHWRSLDKYLPLIAEISPEIFFGRLNDMLEHNEEELKELLEVTGDHHIFPIQYHTGLLWALETLAWIPNDFVSSVNALFLLNELHSEGRTGNSPESSLLKILTLQEPQTFASFKEVKEAISGLVKQNTDKGWKLAHLLVSDLPYYSSQTSTPELISVLHLKKLTPSIKEIEECVSDIIWLLINNINDNLERIELLMWSYLGYPEQSRREVRKFIADYKEEHSVALWELIRRILKLIENKEEDLPSDEIEELNDLCQSLKPDDYYDSSLWLFNKRSKYLRNNFVDSDYKKSMAVIEPMQHEVLSKLYKDQGCKAVLEFVHSFYERDYPPPYYQLPSIISEEDQLPFLKLAFKINSNLHYNYSRFASRKFGFDWMEKKVEEMIKEKFSTESVVSFLLASSHYDETLYLANKRKDEIKNLFYKHLDLSYRTIDNQELLHKVIENSTNVYRVADLFDLILGNEIKPSKECLKDMLHKIFSPEDWDQAPSRESVHRMMNYINQRDDFEGDELLELEMTYLPFYISLIDSGLPPRINDLSQNSEEYINLAQTSFRLESERKEGKIITTRLIVNKVTITDEDLKNDPEKLSAWIDEVLEAFEGDEKRQVLYWIGKSLGRSFYEEDYIIPKVLWSVLDKYDSQDLFQGWYNGENEGMRMRRREFGAMEIRISESYLKVHEESKELFPKCSAYAKKLVKVYEIKSVEERDKQVLEDHF